MQKYVFEDWLQTEEELTRERGIWGPPFGSKLCKWMLDMTEGKPTFLKNSVYSRVNYILYATMRTFEGVCLDNLPSQATK